MPDAEPCAPRRRSFECRWNASCPAGGAQPVRATRQPDERAQWPPLAGTLSFFATRCGPLSERNPLRRVESRQRCHGRKGRGLRLVQRRSPLRTSPRSLAGAESEVEPPRRHRELVELAFLRSSRRIDGHAASPRPQKSAVWLIRIHCQPREVGRMRPEIPDARGPAESVNALIATGSREGVRPLQRTPPPVRRTVRRVCARPRSDGACEAARSLA